jgi:hypothetical protein
MLRPRSLAGCFVLLSLVRVGLSLPQTSWSEELPSARIPLRFLQLLCEGVNADMQYVMRTLQVPGVGTTEPTISALVRVVRLAPIDRDVRMVLLLLLLPSSFCC